MIQHNFLASLCLLLAFSCALVAVGCEDDGVDYSSSATPDDPLPDADPGEPDGPSPDPDPSVEVVLPETPTEQALSVVSVVQGTPGESGIITRGTLALEDGGMLVGAKFSGTVTLGGTTLAASDENYRHHMLVRVGSEGALRFVKHLCDGCLGAMGEASDGRIATATSASVCIGDPMGEAIDLSQQEAGPVVTLLDASGNIEAMRRIGVGNVNIRAVTADPKGGWFLGGDTMGVTFENGDTIQVSNEVFYPGQGFIAHLAEDLSVDWVEHLGGTAASTVGTIEPRGDGFVAVGDFGGYPLGVTTEFGAGPDVVLEAVSSDDDPAMDVFVAAWNGPGQVTFAKRIQHYANGSRLPNWLKVDEEGVAFLLDGAGEFEIEGGDLFAGYGEQSVALAVQFSPDGEYLGSVRLPPKAMLWPGQTHYMNVLFNTWQQEISLGDGDLVFDLPDEDENTQRGGLILSHWTQEGVLGQAGQLAFSWPGQRYPINLAAASPQRDGSVLLYFNGSATTQIDGLEPIPLANDGFERMVFVKVRLDTP